MDLGEMLSEAGWPEDAGDPFAVLAENRRLRAGWRKTLAEELGVAEDQADAWMGTDEDEDLEPPIRYASLVEIRFSTSVGPLLIMDLEQLALSCLLKAGGSRTGEWVDLFEYGFSDSPRDRPPIPVPITVEVRTGGIGGQQAVAGTAPTERAPADRQSQATPAPVVDETG